MEIIQNAMQFDFMRNALAAGLLISVAAGILGVYVVLNRVTILSGGIAHAAYGGVGIAYFLGINPLLGGLVFSLIASILMNIVQRVARQRTDMLIGVMWAVGMAIGILFIDHTPGYKVDLMSYLFGSLLAVSPKEIFIILILDLIVILTVLALYRNILAISYDATFASVRGAPVNIISIIVTTLIAVTVVMMMRIVGLILVIALLTLPAATASLISRDMRWMMAIAVFLSAIFTVTGLWLSYTYNLTSGAAIILISAIFYFLGLLIKWGFNTASFSKFRNGVRGWIL